MLFEVAGFPFAVAKPLSAEVRGIEARRYFERWFPKAMRRFELAQGALARRYVEEAAFDLHQATEQLYHCVLLVLTLYSPKLHRLDRLRSQAESLDGRLIAAWPRDTKFGRRCFALLNRAYVEARYSPHYAITHEELTWLVEHIEHLGRLVEASCTDTLAGHRA